MSSNFLDDPLKGAMLFYQYSIYAVLSVQPTLFVPGLSKYPFHFPGILSWSV